MGPSIPVEEIDAVFTASVAATQEMTLLGPSLAHPLLSYALSVYHLDIEKLIHAKPDVILTCLQTAHGAILEGTLRNAALQSVLGYVPTVVHCEAQNLEQVWKDVQSIADALNVPERGQSLIKEQQVAMQSAAASGKGRGRPRVVCIQWPHPMMAAGCWVPEMLELVGARDVCGRVEEAVVVSLQDLQRADPEVIIFALCGLSLEKATKAAQVAVGKMKKEGGVWGGLRAVQRRQVAVVDGEHVFSRPGPLLSTSLECLVEILFPEAQRYGHQDRLWRWMATGG